MPDLFSNATASHVEREEKRVSPFGVAYPMAREPSGYTVHLILGDATEHRIEISDLERLQAALYLLRTFEEIEFDAETQILTCGPELPGEAASQRRE